jgi:uncharacterized protein YecA (UPF0149 family)
LITQRSVDHLRCVEFNDIVYLLPLQNVRLYGVRNNSDWVVRPNHGDATVAATDTGQSAVFHLAAAMDSAENEIESSSIQIFVVEIYLGFQFLCEAKAYQSENTRGQEHCLVLRVLSAVCLMSRDSL